MQGYNVQEADRMSVAIHPSETRRAEALPRAVTGPSRLRLLGGLALGGTALAAFTAGALSFFSGLADPRAKTVRVTPVASQWPELKDGVPALSGGSMAEAPRLNLPPAEPPARAEATAPAPIIAAPVRAAEPAPLRPEPARTASVAPTGRPNLPIEPAQTLPPARAAAPVTPAKVAPALAPSRAETVRAKEEQPARFVSLPAPKAKAEAAKPEAVKAIPAKPEKAEAARKPAAPARTRVTEARPADAPAAVPAPAAVADDEPELLGMKIPGGRQIRAGWDAAVGGLLGGKKDAE